MRARLFCRTGEMTGSTYDFSDDVTIGRGTSNDMVLHASIISDRHARIRVRRGECILEDLKSANGTDLDGMPVKEPVRLGNLHVVTFAKAFDFIFLVLEEEEEMPSQAAVAPAADAARPKAQPTQSPKPQPKAQPKKPPKQPGGRDVPAKAPAEGRGTRVDAEPFRPLPELDPGTSVGQEAAAAGGTRFHMEPLGPLPDLEEPGAETALPRLGVQFSDGRKESHALRVGANTIGRAPECDVTLEVPSLSRQHARVTVTDASSTSVRPWTVTIEDLGSMNGTQVDGKVISEVVALHPGSKIALGPEVVAKLEVP